MPGWWQPRQSKPMSIMRSKTMLVTRVVIRLIFMLLMLVIVQMVSRGSYVV